MIMTYRCREQYTLILNRVKRYWKSKKYYCLLSQIYKYIAKLSFITLISNHYSLAIFDASNFASMIVITIIYFQSFKKFSLKEDLLQNLQLNKITVIRRHINAVLMFEIHKSLINELLRREMFMTRALLTLRVNVTKASSRIGIFCR